MAYRVINQNAFEVVVGGKTIPPSGWAVVQVIPQGVPSEVFRKLTFTLTNDPNIDDASIGYEAAVGLGSSGSAQGAAADNVITSIGQNISKKITMGTALRTSQTLDGDLASPALNLNGTTQDVLLPLGTNVILPAPTNLPPQGWLVSMLVTQDATGGRTLAFNDAYKNVSAYSNTGNTANKKNLLTWMSDGTNLVLVSLSGWY